MDIVQKQWPWTEPPQTRSVTNYIVVHHTDGPQMQDVDEIWQEHINEGWIGIGYHFVIKGDGTIVAGRPIDAIGAQAQDINFDSIGIALEGDFQSTESVETPTDAQLASLKWLIPYCLQQYPGAQIVGHLDAARIANDPSVATDCPGDTFYKMLPAICKELGAVWGGQ